MNNTFAIPFLCSNLGSRNCFNLKISLISEDISTLEKIPFPFLVVTDSDPLTRLVEAQLETDAGSEIDKVFLVLQKDHYLMAQDDLRPINNQDVDGFWQAAFTSYRNEKKDKSFIMLSYQIHQIDQTECLVPFPPLFFCKQRQLFFHPPCPKCGLPLQQCYDDDPLTRSGLQPYTRSLKRYLFCASCGDTKGNTDFYTYELESSDPPELKDRRHLMEEFAFLIGGKKSHLHQFPCSDCHCQQECYGSDTLVLKRMTPFSFYPFYMFIFKAPSVHASDFLALVSGASFEELEKHLFKRQELGRMTCLKTLRQDRPVKALMFSDKGQKRFLEVLYLKLSFLGDLFQETFTSLNTHRRPHSGLSFDRIWVKLAGHAGLLPFFWNFTVNTIDIGKEGSASGRFFRYPQSFSLYYFGLIWFYTLLGNGKQDSMTVYQCLEQEIDKLLSDDFSSGKNEFQKGADRSFSPENIFWNPEEMVIGENENLYWDRTLNMGWSLLRACFLDSTHWSREEFWQKLEALREEVKNTLFQPTSPCPETTFEKDYQARKENEAIYDILMKIMNRWQTCVYPHPIEEKMKDDDLEETVVLSSGSFTEKGRQGDDPKPISAKLPPKHEDESIPETVILSSSKAARVSPEFSPKIRSNGFNAEERTLEKETEKEEESKKAEFTKKPEVNVFDPDEDAVGNEPEQDDFSSETVILTPNLTQDEKKKSPEG